MTLRSDMIATIGRATGVLGEASTQVARFFQGLAHPDGGFQGRAEHADLYYSVFGLEGAMALGIPLDIPVQVGYLNTYGDGGDLDLVHLACLARCWATLSDITGAALDPRLQHDLINQLTQLRCPDGGFNTDDKSQFGSAYGNFLALGIYQDLNQAIPDQAQLLGSLMSLQRENGAFTNDRTTPIGSTPASAAALCVLHYLDHPIPEKTLPWLLSQVHAQGGFTAVPTESVGATPDLLSTATALFALSRTPAKLSTIREICLDFCDSLWHPEGAFAGHILDPTVDCEYTYYGLLALGVLSEA